MPRSVRSGDKPWAQYANRIDTENEEYEVEIPLATLGKFHYRAEANGDRMSPTYRRVPLSTR